MRARTCRRDRKWIQGEDIEITDEELEAIALESPRTIEIDEFVPRKEFDELYNIRPYYIAPDGKVGQRSVFLGSEGKLRNLRLAPFA